MTKKFTQEKFRQNITQTQPMCCHCIYSNEFIQLIDRLQSAYNIKTKYSTTTTFQLSSLQNKFPLTLICPRSRSQKFTGKQQ